MGQDGAGARTSRTTWWRAPAPATSRPSSASPGRASPATSRRTSSPDERARPPYRFAVNVTPKPGILDPQGKAVEHSLPHLGIAGVSGVRVGRRVEMTVAAADEAAARAVVDRLAGELLSNPLMELFEVEALGEATAPAVAGVGG